MGDNYNNIYRTTAIKIAYKQGASQPFVPKQISA